MWEMQQLGRRAGALDIDLMSSQPGKQTNKLLSSLLGVVLERGGINLLFARISDAANSSRRSQQYKQ